MLELTQNSCKPNKYIILKHKFGSFWGLYLTGINHISDLKYAIIHLIIQFTIDFITTNLTNQLIIHNATNTNSTMIITFCLFGLFNQFTSYFFESKKNEERHTINKRIAERCNQMMLGASNEWHNNNPQAAQESGIRETFNTYNQMTHVLTNALVTTIDTLTLLLVVFTNNTTFCIIIIFSTIFLLQIRAYLNEKLKKLNESMGDLSKQCDLKTSNQFANRADVWYNKQFSDILNPSEHNPVEGIFDQHNIWVTRNNMSRKSNVVIGTLSRIIIMLSLVYMIKIGNPSMVIFILINNNRIFGFLDVMARMDEFKNIAGGRLNQMFRMLDTIGECDDVRKDQTNNFFVDQNVMSVQVNGLFKQVTSDIRLQYDGVLNLSFAKNIIILDGPKGCGKSTTMELLAGLYDNKVTNGVTVNNNGIPNEFKAFIKNRTFVRQNIAGHYIRNKLNTVTMSLAQLFPGGTFDEIRCYLEDFDVAHKIPGDLNSPISKSEKGLSGGQLQALILASLFWKAKKVGSWFVLLDEPELCIDFKSVRKIFDTAIERYKGLVILITHNDLLKRYLINKGRVGEIWRYKDNKTELSFEVRKLKYPLISLKNLSRKYFRRFSPQNIFC